MGPVLCDPQSLIKDLNPQQMEAVKYYGQALLIGAGAGSGKTRVLTRRIAWLLAHGFWASSILAITFPALRFHQLWEYHGHHLHEQGRSGNA